MGKITPTGISQGDLYNYLSNLRTRPLSSFQFQKWGSNDLAIGGTFDYAIDGRIYRCTGYTQVDTGTAQHCAAGKWNVMLISIDSSGDTTGTWPSGTTGYATEADAIAMMADCPSGECPVGYYTVQADDAATWTAGTDAFEGKSGGTAAQDDTIYNSNDALNVQMKLI